MNPAIPPDGGRAQSSSIGVSASVQLQQATTDRHRRLKALFDALFADDTARPGTPSRFASETALADVQAGVARAEAGIVQRRLAP